MVKRFSTRNRNSRRRQRSTDFEVDTREPKRFEQFLSRNFTPEFKLQNTQKLASVNQSKLGERFFSKKAYQEAYAKNYVKQAYNEKLEWKEKGVNPVTLNLPAQVYPYGGGLAPHRNLTKQELVVYYLGSRAVANTIMQYKIENGTANVDPEDAQSARNRLIKGDIVDGRNVPLVPYPILTDRNGEESFRVGSIEESVLRNRQWWNANTPGLDIQPVQDRQVELTDSQVNAVWDRVSPEMYKRVGNPLLQQDIGRERLVPSIRGHEPLVRNDNGKFVKAVHGFDFDGTINSARNQELQQLIQQELEVEEYNSGMYSSGSKEESIINNRIDLLRQSAEAVAEERTVKPRWAAMQKGDFEDFDDIKRDVGISEDNLDFWGGPLEFRDQIDDEVQKDAIVNWNQTEQNKALHFGLWETNYLNPETEPGMFAAPKTIEYRTLGVNSTYNFEISKAMSQAEGKEVTPGEVERRYIFGQFNPSDYRPTGDDRERFDREVIAKTLNTANSPEFTKALREWRKDGISKQLDVDGKESNTALLYTAPNANKLRLEQNFSENPFSTSSQKTSRHDFARNVAGTKEQENDFLNSVEPLQEGLINGPDAQSVEKGLREESRIWGEYARVRGDEKGGFKIQQ